MHKRERKLGTNRCQCVMCGEYFNSTFAFDKHRTGEFGERVCLTEDAMREKGMATNATGWWVSEMWEGAADAVSSRTCEQISASEASDVVLHVGATETPQERVRAS